MQVEIQWPGGVIATPVCRLPGWPIPHPQPDRSGAGNTTERDFVRAETARIDLAGGRRWVRAMVSMLGGLWSRVLRVRETARVRVGWEALDDRTLRDIGVSRYEIEYAYVNGTGADVIASADFAPSLAPDTSIGWRP
jgi:uncharacterized protein YjiS (DUF1127 family)